MRDDKCPSCENDISDTVTAAVVSRLQAGGSEADPIACPHCGSQLILTVNIDTRLSLLGQ